MIEHIGIKVKNLEESHNFYQPLLASIGVGVTFKTPQCIAYGSEGKPSFEIYSSNEISSAVHIAFHASDQGQVDTFHKTGLDLGAKDNGPPGYKDYFPGYYAAFIIDPNGHNLEALWWNEDSLHEKNPTL